MKSYFLAIFSMICFTEVTAQQNFSFYPKPTNAPDATTIILGQLEKNKPVKNTRALDKRLIGINVYGNGYIRNNGHEIRSAYCDSIFYKYVGNKNGRIVFDSLDKDYLLSLYNVPLPNYYTARIDSSISKIYIDTLTFNNPTQLNICFLNASSFDTNNFMIQNLRYDWSDTAIGYYDTLEKQLFVNNAVGLPLDYIRLKWNGLTQIWDTITTEINLYNSNNLIITKQTRSYYLNSKSGFNYYFNYDTNNNIISSKAEFIDNLNQTSFSSFDTIVYNNNTVLNYNSNWNSTINQWENNKKTEIHYLNNNIISLYLYSWNFVTSAWDPAYIHNTIQYNANDKMIHYLRKQTNGIGGTDSIVYKYDRNTTGNLTKFTTINNSNNLDTSIIYYNYDADNYLTSFTDSINPFDTNYIHSGTFNFFYEPYNNGIPTSINANTNPIQQATLFPNAANINSYVSFTTKNDVSTTIQIVDMQGKLVYTTTEKGAIGDHLVKLPVATLGNGIYLVRIANNNNVLQTLQLSVLH